MKKERKGKKYKEEAHQEECWNMQSKIKCKITYVGKTVKGCYNKKDTNRSKLWNEKENESHWLYQNKTKQNKNKNRNKKQNKKQNKQGINRNIM